MFAHNRKVIEFISHPLYCHCCVFLTFECSKAKHKNVTPRIMLIAPIPLLELKKLIVEPTKNDIDAMKYSIAVLFFSFFSPLPSYKTPGILAIFHFTSRLLLLAYLKG